MLENYHQNQIISASVRHEMFYSIILKITLKFFYRNRNHL